MPEAIHPRHHAFIRAGMILTCFLFSQGEVYAQATKDQQKCVNELNKNFARVAKAKGREICKCIKRGSKSSLGNQSIEECVTADNGGKVGKATRRTIDRATDKCPVPPYFGAADPQTAF